MPDNRKLMVLMDGNLISPSMLAREAGVDVKTLHALLKRRHQTRMQTKRTVLDGLNALLEKRGQKPVGPEIFD